MEEYLKQIVLNLERIADSLVDIQKTKTCKDISYVEELRMYHSCIDCLFLEQCQSDADLEYEKFDYLVCENFEEV